MCTLKQLMRSFFIEISILRSFCFNHEYLFIYFRNNKQLYMIGMLQSNLKKVLYEYCTEPTTLFTEYFLVGTCLVLEYSLYF